MVSSAKTGLFGGVGKFRCRSSPPVLSNETLWAFGPEEWVEEFSELQYAVNSCKGDGQMAWGEIQNED